MGCFAKVNPWPWWALSAIVVVIACATPEYQHGALAGQLLRPRPGHPGKLTNLVCRGKDCAQPDVVEYDLTLPADREKLRAARFVCKLGELAYQVSAETPELVRRQEQVTKRFPNVSWGIPVKRELVVTDQIDAVAGYQRLIDGDTRCAAQGSPEYRRLFP